MERISIRPDCVFTPQPLYLIGTQNADGSANFCDITWLGFSCDDGPCLMLTIGDPKLTLTNILREKRFSACMVTQDILWLADYLGCSRGEDGPKDRVPYGVHPGEKMPVPVLDDCHWAYECRVERVTETAGGHLILGHIENIRIDRALAHMDLTHIDLGQVQPVIYAPYGYYATGEKLGDVGEWKAHLK